MTEPALLPLSSDDRQKAFSLHLKARHRRERRFRLIGLLAILCACGFLINFLFTIASEGIPAFFQHYLRIDVALDSQEIDPSLSKDPKLIGQANYDLMIKKAVRALLPSATSKQDQRALAGLASSGASILLRDAVLTSPDWIGSTQSLEIPLSASADLYLKGQITGRKEAQPHGELSVSSASGTVSVSVSGEGFGGLLGASSSLSLDPQHPSILIAVHGGMIKLTRLDTHSAEGVALVPLSSSLPAAAGQWRVVILEVAEANRKLSDRDVVFLAQLQQQGRIEKRLSREFFTSGASREPELAGIWSAVAGSFLTLCVTLGLSFPIGVGAALYLEEFAPKNRWTEWIEVNINNLAAVPSIIFGLLGLAVFLNIFGLPRSAPVVGGLVLALMTLPIIIIASRAALRSVPPSIKQAALGMGASPMQVVFHHQLPLAMPGILTGTILGMAHALGETAPLLMIGMVAFVVDVPKGFTDAATLLPVQIFMWADFPEAGFQQKTAAAILVLLVFLVMMNGLAVLLRKKFERRWS